MTDRVRIPSSLQNDEFRFVKIPTGEKFPFEKSWQKESNYAWNDSDFQDHLENGGNYGVVGGYGNLTIIDVDKPEVERAVRENLPKTFTIRTGGGGHHFYYICEDLDRPIRLKEDMAGDLGDVQYTGKQVVGANSLHPNGKRYEVEKNLPIQEVSAEGIRFALRDFLEDESEHVVREERETLEKSGIGGKIPINKVVPLNNLKQVGKEFQGSHPIHGSTTGHNFCVNPSDGVWHCFRHGTGGGSLSWLAVQEGIINCSEAVPGALRGDKFVRVLEKAKERGLIGEEDLKRDVKKIRVHDLEASLIGKFVEIDGQIIGEKSGKAIPTKVKASCRKCGASREVSFSPRENPRILEMYLFHRGKSRNSRIRGFLRPILDSFQKCDSGEGHPKSSITLKFSHYDDYSILFVRDLLENIKGERRAYSPRTIHLVGHRIPEAKKVKLVGKVALNPNSEDIVAIADSIEPLGTELTTFKISKEDKENFTRHFSELEGVHREVAPHIVGKPRNLPKRWLVRSLHTPPEIPDIYGRRIKGIILIAFYGDTSAGKTETAKDFTDAGDFPIPLGVYDVCETGGRTGILYTIDSDKRALIWGDLVLNDLGFVVLDGIGNMASEELSELREVLRTGRVSVRKTVSGDAWARTRIIACFNPEKPMNEQLFTCQGITDTQAFRRGPEITRWDVFLPFKLDDVDVETITGSERGGRPIPPEIFYRHILWAWSRDFDEVEYTQEAKEEIAGMTKELLEKYSAQSLPIISNESFNAICRFAVAEASMRHSTSADHSKIIVEPEHVQDVVDDYERVLRLLELDLYKKSMDEELGISLDEFDKLFAKLGETDLRILKLLGRKPHSAEEIADTLGDISTRSVKEHYKPLKKHEFVKTKRGVGVELTPRGIVFLRMLRDHGGELSQEELVEKIREVWKSVGGGTTERERFVDVLQTKFEDEPRKRLEEAVKKLEECPKNPLYFKPKVERLEE